jgi:hypothetical protein
VWGLSGVYVTLTAGLGKTYTTYDCGLGTVTICHNGIACHQIDLPAAVSLVKSEFTAKQQEHVRDRAWKELKERMDGRGNQAAFQVRAAGDAATSDFNVLVPLNLRWDSAALARKRLFETVEDWIVAVLRWAESEPNARVCFRQHPSERETVLRGSDDIGDLMARENKIPERVRFVAAEDDVNTYEVLRTIKVVSPYTSSVGVEAGMLGIPVIVSAHNYYDHASFVQHPETREEYFALLSHAIRGELSVAPEGTHDAALFYHLVQECNILPTHFTPAPGDFVSWVKVPPDQLWHEPACADLRESLMTGRPLSYLASRRVASTVKG